MFLETPEEKIMTDAYEVGMRMHRQLGPGLYEHVYETIFCHEMAKLGHEVKRQVDVSIEWDGLMIEKAFKIDVLINDLVVFELKSTTEVHPIHFMQLKTHVVLSRKRLGAVMNFGLRLFKDGFQRFVNGLPE
jgi:GxxExxY protein